MNEIDENEKADTVNLDVFFQGGCVIHVGEGERSIDLTEI